METSYHKQRKIRRTNIFCWAVVVDQLVEQSLPKPDVCGSDPVIGKIYIEHCLLSTLLKIMKTMPGKCTLKYCLLVNINNVAYLPIYLLYIKQNLIFRLLNVGRCVFKCEVQK